VGVPKRRQFLKKKCPKNKVGKTGGGNGKAYSATVVTQLRKKGLERGGFELGDNRPRKRGRDMGKGRKMGGSWGVGKNLHPIKVSNKPGRDQLPKKRVHRQGKKRITRSADVG